MSAIQSIGRAKMRALSHTRNTPDTPPPTPSARLWLRAARALWFGARMVGGFVWWELILARVIGQRRVERGRMPRLARLARRFRLLAIDLGGVWIKLGQFLSSRVDIMPPEVIAELQDLQDAVPPEDPLRMFASIERELGKPAGAVFEEFDRLPIAAASFGQVYLATLSPEVADGPARRVIVKIQRSNLDALVATDLRALGIICGWLKHYKPIRKRANLDALVREFGAGITAELDYEQEARNAAQFDMNFAADSGVRVPKVVQGLTTRRLIVLKNVEDIKITDFAGLEAAGVSRPDVARKLFDTYLKQVFTDGFYHADPHPGNLFVQPVDAATARSWRLAPGAGTAFRLTYVDFGMMGTVPPSMIQELKEFIIAVALRDAHRWTAAAQRLGFFLPEADLARVEQAVSVLFEKFWGKGMNDLTSVDFGDMLQFSNQFKDLLATLPFQVPQNILFLGRAANILSGMTVALDPAFNPWQALQPFATGMAAGSPVNPLKDIGGEALKFARTAISLPAQTDAFFTRALSGQLELRTQFTQSSSEDLRRIEKSVNRLGFALIGAALLGCGTALLISQFAVAGVALMALGGLAVIRMLF